MGQIKEIKGKIVFKHQTEAEWHTSNNGGPVQYMPAFGEKVLYDPDEKYSYTRVKYGDGEHIVAELPFSVEQVDWEQEDPKQAGYIVNKPPIEGNEVGGLLQKNQGNANYSNGVVFGANNQVGVKITYVNGIGVANGQAFALYVSTKPNDNPVIGTYEEIIGQVTLDYGIAFEVSNPENRNIILVKGNNVFNLLIDKDYAFAIGDACFNVTGAIDTSVFAEPGECYFYLPGYPDQGVASHPNMNSFVIGENNRTAYNNSFVGGFDSVVEDDIAFAHGKHLKVLNESGVGFGSNNQAGVKGFYYSVIDFTNKRLILSDTQPVGSNAIEVREIITPEHKIQIPYNVGDVLNIVNDTKYDCKMKVVAVNYDMIEVNRIPFSEIISPSQWNEEDASIYAVYNEDEEGNITPVDLSPTGSVDIGKNAQFVAGVGNVVTGRQSAAFGITNTVVGDYAFAEGWGNTVVTGSHAEGSKHRVLGQFAHAEGGSNEITDWYAHAEGYQNKATARCAHAEGNLVEAKGQYSHAEGFKTKVTESFAHAEGNETLASGQNSHAEGYSTEAKATNSHAEGNDTVASGDGAHSEGVSTQALHAGSHAEGSNTTANGTNAHAEGMNTTAGGVAAHTEGHTTTVTGWAGHAEGYSTTAAACAHAEGSNNTASGQNSHAEGMGTTAAGKAAHAEGNGSKTTADFAHAEGNGNTAGLSAHAEGKGTTASGEASHAEGVGTKATHEGSHAEGKNTTAGLNAHSEGIETQALATATHAEGHSTVADGWGSHTEGYKSSTSQPIAHAEGIMSQAKNFGAHAEGGMFDGKNYIAGGTASGIGSHAEGVRTTASGIASHAEGEQTEASGNYSHAEGFDTHATGRSSHAEGECTVASGTCAHTSGMSTVASGNYSNAFGYNLTASAECQTVVGKYNAENDEALFIVGDGYFWTGTTADPAHIVRENAFEVVSNSSGYAIKVGNTTITEAQLAKLIRFLDTIEI